VADISSLSTSPRRASATSSRARAPRPSRGASRRMARARTGRRRPEARQAGAACRRGLRLRARQREGDAITVRAAPAIFCQFWTARRDPPVTADERTFPPWSGCPDRGRRAPHRVITFLKLEHLKIRSYDRDGIGRSSPEHILVMSFGYPFSGASRSAPTAPGRPGDHRAPNGKRRRRDRRRESPRSNRQARQVVMGTNAR